MATKSRHVVETSGRVARGKHCGRPRLWAYGYADLAALFDRSEWWVRAEVRAGRLDPGDLASVVARATAPRRRGERRQA